MLRGVDFPKSHDLDVLVDLLDPADGDQLDRGALLDLTPWAVAGRYPEDIPEPSEGETRRLIDDAATLVEKVSATILGVDNTGESP